MQQEPKDNNPQPIDMNKLIEARRKGEKARVAWEWIMDIVGCTYENKAQDVLKNLQDVMTQEEIARNTMNDLMRQADGMMEKTGQKTRKKRVVSVSN